MGRPDGKVAVVTGAATGQGTSHCQLLAEEGADLIAIDLLENIDTVEYALGSPEDMADTVALVEATGQRIFSAKADVCERDQLRDAIGKSVAEFGNGLHMCAPTPGSCRSRNRTRRRPSSMPWTSTSAA